MSNSCVVYTDNLQHLALAMAHKWTLLLPVEVKSYTVPGRPSQYPRHFPTLSDPLRNKEIVTMAYYLPLFPGRESQAELHSPRSFEGSNEILVLSRCILGFEAHSRV
jgi:hypothetical protein